jgi:hypothetical protein
VGIVNASVKLGSVEVRIVILNRTACPQWQEEVSVKEVLQSQLRQLRPFYRYEQLAVNSGYVSKRYKDSSERLSPYEVNITTVYSILTTKGPKSLPTDTLIVPSHVTVLRRPQNFHWTQWTQSKGGQDKMESFSTKSRKRRHNG